MESRHVIDGRAPAGRAAPAEADLARRCREGEAPERWSRTDCANGFATNGPGTTPDTCGARSRASRAGVTVWTAVDGSNPPRNT